MASIIRESDPSCIDVAAGLLRQGELVCFPTDTVYGLGADVGNEDAVRRLFAVKGRPLNKPMPLLLSDAAESGYYAEVTPVARTLMARFWPGPLTIVMRKSPGFGSFALGGQDMVALRVPDHDVPRSLVRALGGPITGTSANRAAWRAPTTASEVMFSLGEMVSLVIDGGTARGAQESTVIDITDQKRPAIVREGAVRREELREVLGKGLE